MYLCPVVQFIMRKVAPYCLLSIVYCLLPAFLFSQVLSTYNCTGSVQNYIVPAGVCQVQIKAWGAGGGGGGIDGFGGGAGGGGTYADVVINVVAGDVLAVYVGCSGIGGTGCATNPGGTGGFGYGAGGNGGNAGPIPCSGSGGGGGGSSGVLLNGVPAIVAAGGGGGGGAGCTSAGGDGGAGGINGNGSTCTGGGSAAGNASANGAAGQSHIADGGGGGGGGGGYLNGGQGGFAPPVGPSCNAATDCGAGGGGGGNSFAPAGTITNGSGITPGNSADPDLCAGCAQGGGSLANGTNGFVKIIASITPVVATISSNSPICQGFTLNLNSSGGGTYSWAGPNSFSSALQNPSIPNATPGASGIYTVTVTNGCTATLTVNVVVNPLPAASAGNNLTICNGDVATLNASGGTIYSWIPSTSLSNPNIFNPTANPASTISYTVVVTDANGCINAASMSVTVNPLPVPAISGNNTICFSAITTLTASGGAAYLWNTNATTASISVSPPATITYTVVVISANSCTAVATMPVTVNPLPVPLFTAPAVCQNNLTLFTDQSTTASGVITNWNWNFGDGNTSTTQSPTNLYSTPGTFTVTLIVTNSFGCVDTLQQSVVVYPVPIASFSATIVCLGSTTNFTDLTTISSGTIIAWNWNFGDPNSGPNNLSNIQHPSHTYTASGTFNVLLTAMSSDSCPNTTNLLVIVLPLPVASFTAPDECLNTPTVFTDASTGTAQWQWDFGDGGNSGLQTPSHTYLGNGTYIVTLIVTSSGGCKDTITDTVTVYALPVVIFISDSVCEGETTSFSDLSSILSGSISTWNWNFGDPASGVNNTSALQNPTHVFTPPSAPTYNVTLTATSNNGCVSSVVLPVIVHPLPVADFDSDPGPIVSLTDNVAFNDLSTYPMQWLWDFGDSTTMDSTQYPSHVYSDTGTYMVTLIVISQYGCVDTVQHPVTIKDFTFYVPNAFTPNGDDVNEFFFGTGIGIKEYEMWIFDRWGNQIFFCRVNDLPQTQPCMWDGKVRGGGSNEKVHEDVYVWKARLTNAFKKEFNYTGTVSVVK